MNTSLEQTIERLAINAEIRDLAARFSDAVNRADPGAFGDLFADDGVWETGEPFPSRAAGRQNVTTMFKNLRAPWEFFFQMTHSGVIDMAADPQTATARWEIQEIAPELLHPGTGRNAAGAARRSARAGRRTGHWQAATRGPAAVPLNSLVTGALAAAQ